MVRRQDRGAQTGPARIAGAGRPDPMQFQRLAAPVLQFVDETVPKTEEKAEEEAA